LTSRLRAVPRHDGEVTSLASRLAAGRTDGEGGASGDQDDDEVVGGRRSQMVSRALSAGRRRSGGEGSGGGSSRDSRRAGLLSDDEVRSIEETYADGLTAVQIVEVFTRRGIKFSEASFRKYVQQGLLPRSKRVGRKGKHRGSLGVYPSKTVRRINAVKRLMTDGLTIEEIQAQHLQYTDLVEGIDEALTELFARLETELAESAEGTAGTRRGLSKDVAEARRAADELMRRLEDVARRATAPRADRIRRSGAAGSAEDLL
jgi:DNA-binding transcriptional MerR regulator